METHQIDNPNDSDSWRMIILTIKILTFKTLEYQRNEQQPSIHKKALRGGPAHLLVIQRE